MDPLLVRVVIGAGLWVILEALFSLIITDPKVKRIFDLILIIAVVVYVLFGGVLFSR